MDEKERPNEQLIEAAIKGDLEGVKRAISCGADINVRNKDGDLPLILAAYYGRSIEVVEYLVRNGANVHIRDELGVTALMRSAINGPNKIFEYLLSESGGIEELKKQIKDQIKHEKDLSRKLFLKIRSSQVYKKVIVYLGKETQIGDVKTIRLPERKQDRFRMRKLRIN